MTDFLVLGSGIAGLSFAINAAKHGSVTVITKGKLLNSNTAWAQGGISALLPPELREPGDSLEKHLADTLDAGAGLCNEDATRTILEEAAETISELVNWGTEFDRDEEDPDRYSLGKEGGHSARRILHAKDTTGREIAESLIETARKTPHPPRRPFRHRPRHHRQTRLRNRRPSPRSLRPRHQDQRSQNFPLKSRRPCHRWLWQNLPLHHQPRLRYR